MCTLDKVKADTIMVPALFLFLSFLSALVKVDILGKLVSIKCALPLVRIVTTIHALEPLMICGE